MKIGSVILIGLLAIACDAQEDERAKIGGIAAGKILLNLTATAGGGSRALVQLGAGIADQSDAGSIALAAANGHGLKANAHTAAAAGGDQSAASAVASASATLKNYNNYGKGHGAENGEGDKIVATRKREQSSASAEASLSSEDYGYVFDYETAHGSNYGGREELNANLVAARKGDQSSANAYASSSLSSEVYDDRSRTGGDEEGSKIYKSGKRVGGEDSGRLRYGYGGVKEDRNNYEKIDGGGKRGGHSRHNIYRPRGNVNVNDYTTRQFQQDDATAENSVAFNNGGQYVPVCSSRCCGADYNQGTVRTQSYGNEDSSNNYPDYPYPYTFDEVVVIK